jgi:hypothetical protein
MRASKRETGWEEIRKYIRKYIVYIIYVTLIHITIVMIHYGSNNILGYKHMLY